MLWFKNFTCRLKGVRKKIFIFSVLITILIAAVFGYISIFQSRITAAAGEDWLPNYAYRRQIIINHTQVESDLINFPVLISIIDYNLKSTANGGHVENNNGYDIALVDSSGTTTLDYEREKYDPSAGELVAWVKSDLSANGDTVLYIYYGNAYILTDQTTTTGVWDSNYAGIYHLNNNVNDSTVNGYIR